MGGTLTFYSIGLFVFIWAGPCRPEQRGLEMVPDNGVIVTQPRRDVSFVCVARNFGRLRRGDLTWRDNHGNLVTSSGSQRIHAVAYDQWQVSRLVIRAPHRSDTGVYTCEVTTRNQTTAQFLASLIVEDIPQPDKNDGPRRGDIYIEPDPDFGDIRPVREASGDRRYRIRQMVGKSSGGPQGRPHPALIRSLLGSHPGESRILTGRQNSPRGVNMVLHKDSHVGGSTVVKSAERRVRRQADITAGNTDPTAAMGGVTTQDNPQNFPDSAMTTESSSSRVTGQPDQSTSQASKGGVSSGLTSEGPDVTKWPPTTTRAHGKSTGKKTSVGENATTSAYGDKSGSTKAGESTSPGSASMPRPSPGIPEISPSDHTSSPGGNPHSSVNTQAIPDDESSRAHSTGSGITADERSSAVERSGSGSGSGSAGLTPASGIGGASQTNSPTSSAPPLDVGDSLEGKEGEGETDFGRYGMVAFCLALAIIILLLVAIVLFFLLPRCCPQRGSAFFSVGPKESGDSKDRSRDPNEVVFLGERPHKPLAPMTSATGLNGEFITPVDLEVEEVGEGEKKGDTTPNGGMAEGEKATGGGDPDSNKPKESYVSTFMIGRLSSSKPTDEESNAVAGNSGPMEDNVFGPATSTPDINDKKEKKINGSSPSSSDEEDDDDSKPSSSDHSKDPAGTGVDPDKKPATSGGKMAEVLLQIDPITGIRIDNPQSDV